MRQENKRRKELEQLNKADLIDGYLLLEKRLATLEAQMDAFNLAWGIKPDKTPASSSVPPSQERKVNLKPKKKAERGPKK